jgi:hypothetical protein
MPELIDLAGKLFAVFVLVPLATALVMTAWMIWTGEIEISKPKSAVFWHLPDGRIIPIEKPPEEKGPP